MISEMPAESGAMPAPHNGSSDESAILAPLLNQMAAEFFSMMPMGSAAGMPGVSAMQMPKLNFGDFGNSASVLSQPASQPAPVFEPAAATAPTSAAVSPTMAPIAASPTTTSVGAPTMYAAALPQVGSMQAKPSPGTNSSAAANPTSYYFVPDDAGIPANAHSPTQVESAPSVYAAALPQVSSMQAKPSLGMSPGAASPTSFYFLQNDSDSSADAGLNELVSQALPASGAGAQNVGHNPGTNSGQDHVQQLLRSMYAPEPTGVPAQAPTSSSASPFYFEQHEQSYWDTKPKAKEQGARTGMSQGGFVAPFDINAVRNDFPILSERVNGRQLVWFDNAATTQKPQAVIDRLAYFYEHENSNIHRAAHELAARATDAYEGARDKVRDFLGASSSEEIIFVRGATEGINLVAQTFGKQFIGAGDEIIVSTLEHHANIVPWQQLAAEKGAKIRVIPVDDSGQIILSEYAKLLNNRTKLVSITQVSNALGTITPVKQIIDMAHASGVRVLVDGAQAVSHLRVNVQALDADFYIFSGHKVFGPTGIGAVYGKKELLNQLPPWQGGGNMIADVTFEHTQYQPAPSRFEAGTGNIADAVGLGAALDYVQKLGLENIAMYEHALLEYATHGLKSIPGVRLIGTATEKASVASFVLEGVPTEAVGKALNEEGIAVRSGHHCAQPILRRFGVEATVRPSFAFYNTCEEIDRMIAVVRKLAGAPK